MIDAVLGLHVNPQTCGVAKFNHALAQRLGVPFDWFGRIHRYAEPMVSIKFAEGGVNDWYPGNGVGHRNYHLFIHDATQTDYRPHPDHKWIADARTVTAASQTIADTIRDIRPDVVTAFCPSTLNGNPQRGTYRVLVFGMAHKLSFINFQKLKAQLDKEHPDYTIELSTAVHEGTPWDTALHESVTGMRAIFGDRLRVLGFLGDDALAKELSEVDAVAAFYDPAVRANNTSYWSALEAGKTVYTNRDEHSPIPDPRLHSWDMLTAIIKGAA